MPLTITKKSDPPCAEKASSSAHPQGGSTITSPAGQGSSTSDPNPPKNDLFPHFALVWLALNLLHDAPRRVRRASEKQIRGVLQSIQAYGFRIPILVRTKPDGIGYEVIDGHARLEAARRLEAESILCFIVDDLSDVQIRRMRLSLNKLQETGEWDPEILKIEIEEIIEITGEIQIPGFETPEIEALQFGVGSGEPDPADDVSGLEQHDAPAVSRLGDIWDLGEHRLFNGSARDGTTIAALLNGEAAAACFTDPPYNVPIKGHVRSTGQFAEFAEASGEKSHAEFVAFLIETLHHLPEALRAGAVIFACMDWRHIGEMTEAFKALGIELLNLCVWVKTNPGMGSLYRSQHELVFVGRMPDGSHQNNVQLGKNGRNRTNVWPYAGATGGRHDSDDRFDAHPTVKPIRMVMDALLDVTSPGDLVLDPFLGSGTTLLAAERTRRRFVGAEIEPHYVDLVIRRWQEMTGGQAIHAETGERFDDRAACVERIKDPNSTHSAEDF